MSWEELAKSRDFYLSKKFYNKNFMEIISPLIESIDFEKGVPLEIGGNQDFYSATTATTLLSLHHIHILDDSLRNSLHELMFILRDNTYNPSPKKQNEEDKWAWDVSESASVWSTSLAIWALLETNYNGPRKDEIKEALMWLVNQQNPDGGWGFDTECSSQMLFTSFSLHALKIAINKIELSLEEEKKVKKAISFAINFIIKIKKTEKGLSFWLDYKNEKDPTNTIYALWALFEENNQIFRDEIEKGIIFLRKEIKDKEIWDFNEIISETNTKYRFHKNIISFTPSIPIVLLKLGVDPFDDLCMKPIEWFQKNHKEKGWSLPNFSKKESTFSTSLALWTIEDWQRAVTKKNLKLVEPKILKQLRMRILVLFLLILIIFIFKIGPFLLFLSVNINKFLNLQTIAALITIGGALGFIEFINGRISKLFRKAYRKFEGLLFVK